MQYINLDTLRFLLFEVHDLKAVLLRERFAHLDEPGVNLMLQSAKQWADSALFPYFREMDEQPAIWESGRVKTHPQIREVMRGAGENGWIGGRDDFENGGLQLPEMIYGMIHTIFEAANNAAQGYLGLTGGAARLITAFGTREQINQYVPHLYAGIWQGTMALTEPQAGSSLTDITTTATPHPDGYYLMQGQKIFISGGDHSGAENFIHLTLARIEGAPPGVKGISLFIIPRSRQNEANLVYNDVKTVADFPKLGQRGYATTHLSFGEENDCHGWLVGEPHKGLFYMFQMMNEARIGVGQTAAAVAMAAYMASLQYAQERPQGRLPSNKDPLAPPILIIKHADIQRMLMTQQAIVEGSLSLAAYCSKLSDLEKTDRDPIDKKENHQLLEFLTPIMKTYATEHGIRAVSNGMQVLGGYGYTMDFPLQQYYRDIRIMAIYEGTTGIQSLDLLGRKVLMDQGAPLRILTDRVEKTITQAKGNPALEPYALQLDNTLQQLHKVTQYLSGFAQKGDIDRFTADATVYMELASLMVIGWQWLTVAISADENVENGRFSRNFYEEKQKIMQFFFRHELPHAQAYTQVLLTEATLYNHH